MAICHRNWSYCVPNDRPLLFINGTNTKNIINLNGPIIKDLGYSLH